MTADPAASAQPVPDDDVEDNAGQDEPYDPWARQGVPERDLPASPFEAAEYRQFLQFLNRCGGKGGRRARAEDDEDDDDDKYLGSNSGPTPTWDDSGPIVAGDDEGQAAEPWPDASSAQDNGEQLLKAMDMKELYGDDERKDEVKLFVNFTQGRLSQKDVKAEDEDGADDQTEVLLHAMQDLDEDTGGADEQGTFDEEEAREILSTMVKEHTKRRIFATVREAKKNKSLARGYGTGARYSFGEERSTGGSKELF
ncbi:unnamed protein product [Symbiodinium sp. KB8]|nr:unnamed protein product [Symbiodinium sp. KB8]